MKNKILVVSGCNPCFLNGKEAANYTTYQILFSLLKKKKYKIYFVKVSYVFEKETSDEIECIEYLKTLGLIKTNQIVVSEHISFKKKILDKIKILFNFKNLFFGYRNSLNFEKFCNLIKPHTILTVWTELGTQLAAKINCKKIAYYGNIDFKIKNEIWLNKVKLKKISIFKYFIFKKTYLILYKKAHLDIMRKFNYVFDVAKNDAKYYRKKKIASSYLPIIWKNPFNYKINLLKKINSKDSIIADVISSVGTQDNTANTCGLITIINHIYPELDKRNIIDHYKINVFGKKTLDPFLNKTIKRKNIFNFGYVKKLENYYLTASFGIVPQSYSSLKVSHTRVLYSWALGLPLVVFKDLKLSMPELRNNYNCLISRSPKQFVDNMEILRKNKDVRNKLIIGGLKTLNNFYNPKKLILKLEEKL